MYFKGLFTVIKHRKFISVEQRSATCTSFTKYPVTVWPFSPAILRHSVHVVPTSCFYGYFTLKALFTYTYSTQMPFWCSITTVTCTNGSGGKCRRLLEKLYQNESTCTSHNLLVSKRKEPERGESNEKMEENKSYIVNHTKALRCLVKQAFLEHFSLLVNNRSSNF